ncbi:MAG: Glycosyltransferase AglD [Candidatus Woesearchaeota archaeon]|nr:Glycosyltransferase AglD [Candidatus Woesearchaeota archaeon]
MRDESKIEVSVVMPTLNEAGNITKMIDDVQEVFEENDIKGEIVVVDDYSEDRTADIAKGLNSKYKNIKVIVRNVRDGAGAALVVGYQAARGKVIISIEADCSCDVSDIVNLLEKINQGYDVVVASRYAKGGKNTKTTAKLSKFANIIISKITGIKIHEFTIAYRAFTKEVFENLNLVEKDGNALLVEFLYKAHRAGHKIGEIPTSYSAYRKYGQTKNAIIKAGFNTFKALGRIYLTGK